MKLTATAAAIVFLGGLAVFGSLPWWQPIGGLAGLLLVIWWDRLADLVFGERHVADD